MPNSGTKFIGEFFGIQPVLDVVKDSESFTNSDKYLKDLQLYQHNLPHAKHIPFPKDQGFKCPECSCRVLNHDSKMGEHSCSRCGLVIENVSYSEIRNDQHIQKSHGILEENPGIYQTNQFHNKTKDMDSGWRGYIWLEQMETYTKTGKVPTSGPIVNANPYKEGNSFPYTTKDVCNVLNYRKAYISQEGSTQWRGTNYKPMNNKIELANKILAKLGFKIEKYPQMAERIFYILKKYKLTQIHPKKDKSIVITGIVYYVISEFFTKWDPPLGRRSGVINQCSKREYDFILSNMNRLKTKNKCWLCQSLEYL